VEVFAAAVIIVVASMIVGRAICLAAGGDGEWRGSPAVGFAALVILAEAAIKLPGRATTSGILLLVLVLLAGGFLVRRRSWPWSLVAVGAGVLALLVAAIPFVAAGRIGLPGVSLDDDTSTFLLYTEGLRSARMAALWLPANGYPLGPPSVAAVVSSATGMSLETAFAGLFAAIAALTAITGAGVLRRGPSWARVLTGLLTAFAYLAAAYYGEGSFKETVMALLLLGFVLVLEDARGLPAPTPARCWRALIGGGLLIVAAVYNYSYIGVTWFAATVVIWGAAEAVARPRATRGLITRVTRDRAIELAAWVAGGALVIVVLLLPIASQITTFFSSVGVSAGGSALPAGTLGNLIHPLSVYESFGVWFSNDFRIDPLNGFHSGELSALALAVLALGILASIRRRDFVLAAAVAGCLLIWWRSDGTTHPYVAAKALVIASPLVMALGLRTLLEIRVPDRLGRLVWLVVTAGFCVAAGWSSLSALRTEPVGAPTEGQELASFHHQIGDSSVLYLGDDAYAPWDLRAAAVSGLAPNVLSQGQAALRTGAQNTGLLDFDSVDPADLDHFRFVITSNTPYASAPPANFRLVRRSRLYELWRRTGPTMPRRSLDAPNAPGALLDCTNPSERRLAHSDGVANVMPTPVVAAGAAVPAGGSAAPTIPLPRGRWELSIQYSSSFDLHLAIEGKRFVMPARLGATGQFFSVGDVSGHGTGSPVPLEVSLPKPSALTTANLSLAAISAIAATRVPDTRRTVPLRQACGHYVDWFRLR
jgi:hypothetical protein